MARQIDPTPEVITAMQEMGLGMWIRRVDRAANGALEWRDQGAQRVAVVVPATANWRRELSTVLGAALGVAATGPGQNLGLRPDPTAQPLATRRWVRDASTVGLALCGMLVVAACTAALVERVIGPRR